MKLLVFGQTGQIAREIARAASRAGVDAEFLPRARADFNDPGSLGPIIAASDADIVVNAAAYTAVDKAESDKACAYRVNAEGPGAIAAACADRGLPLIHISTDFVFNGEASAPYTEQSAPAPASVYGASKLAGEEAIRQTGARAVILRTSWVFAGHGHNFVRTMLKLGASRPEINVVADQIGGPTPAGAIAEAILKIAARLKQGAPGGIYHFQGAPAISWAGFARAIFETAAMNVTVNNIPTSGYPTPAKRPAYSVMACSRIEKDFGVPMPDWRAGLAEVIGELLTDGDQ